MHMNPAYFANKVAQHLTQRGLDATIEDVDACRINVKGKTYEPTDDESPSRMAGRIWLAHISGAERLRAIVSWIDVHNESFNDRFTAAELTRLWEYGHLHDDSINELADTWTEEQIAAALARPPQDSLALAREMMRLCPAEQYWVEPMERWLANALSARFSVHEVPPIAGQPRHVLDRVADVLEEDPRHVLLTWDDIPLAEPGRIVDIIIGGRFRPTRATWQKLVDAGLPMCSWDEASESWDLEAANEPDKTDGVRAELARQFAKRGRSVSEAWHMVRRIESGDLILPETHSEPERSLAAKLAPVRDQAEQ